MKGDYPKDPRIYSPDDLDRAILVLSDYLTDGLARRQWKRGDLAAATIEIRDAFRKLATAIAQNVRARTMERLDQLEQFQPEPVRAAMEERLSGIYRRLAELEANQDAVREDLRKASAQAREIIDKVRALVELQRANGESLELLRAMRR